MTADKAAKPFPDIITFARSEHQRFLNDVLACKTEEDYPLPHLYLFGPEGITVMALDIHSNPKLDEFLRDLRASVQMKILYEGFQSAVYCGIIMKPPPLTPDLARILNEKLRLNPASFLDVMAKEHGLINREYVMATAENGSDTFVISQQFHVRKLPRSAPTKKQRKQGKQPPQPIQVQLEGEPVETINEALPKLPHCGFLWPKQREGE